MEKQHYNPKTITEQEMVVLMQKLLKHDFSKDPTLIRLAREAKEFLKKYPLIKD